jgi:predicted XRE-type DNA-binding protein
MTMKSHAAGQGIVATADTSTIFQREIFFQVDPAALDYWDHSDLMELQPSGLHVEINAQQYLRYLPELEAEIFYLIHNKKMAQKNIAQLLDLSQPTISYRYRRVIAKLSYLMILTTCDVREEVNGVHFLKSHEQDILYDLFFYCNQEMVGKRHGVRQSSVKWVFMKTKRKIQELERSNPDRWSNLFGLLILLERNLNIRVLH